MITACAHTHNPVVNPKGIALRCGQRPRCHNTLQMQTVFEAERYQTTQGNHRGQRRKRAMLDVLPYSDRLRLLERRGPALRVCLISLSDRRWAPRVSADYMRYPQGCAYVLLGPIGHVNLDYHIPSSIKLSLTRPLFPSPLSHPPRAQYGAQARQSRRRATCR